ncbi:MAG: hypothetical protein LBQ22_05915 [Bacteroidales bacterium]|jgi:hypothetical protein|nr:hypothetical protein [Bacteroidales bacterium]
MVSGRRQAVDSAFIKANAGMDSLLEKEVVEDVAAYANELNEGSEFKVSAEKKKQVEQHHQWKKRHTTLSPEAIIRKENLTKTATKSVRSF